MNNSNNNIGYFPQMPVCDKHFFTDLSADFSLPDYQPEIKRLLSTRISILPPSEYIGNGNASLSGEVNYYILYLGADNKLYSTKLTDTYSFEVPFEFNSHCVDMDNVTIIPHFSSENINVRVLGPRKLNVKSKVKSRILALTPMLHSALTTEMQMNNNIEKNISKVPILYAKNCQSEIESVSEYIPVENSGDEVRVIDVNSHISVSECNAAAGKIIVKGDVVVKLLYCNDLESELPITCIKKVPFSSTIECEELESSFECSAKGHFCDSEVQVSEQGINIEVSYILTVNAQKNEEVPYLLDAYSTQNYSESKSTPISILAPLKCGGGSLTQNDIFKLDDIKMPADCKIIAADARANVTELCSENGKMFFKGDCYYQITHWLDGEYSSIQASAPFRYELDCRLKNSDTPLRFSASALPISVRTRVDDERLFVDCELIFDTFLQCENTVEILSEISFFEKLEKARDEVILCYPEKDATLWEIGKHYNQALKKIRTQNGLSESDLLPKTKFLVI